MVTAEELKRIACAAIDDAAAELNTVSQEIWSHPEENYEEHHAHKILTDFLESHKFPVERQYITSTGFKSVYVAGTAPEALTKPNISVLCEYDCLPEIGHACGHNLIAEVGVGAAHGIKAALDAANEAGQQLGSLTVFGTPAEEGQGGKLDFIKAGAFDTVDISMMAHPTPINSSHLITTAIDIVDVCYKGKASHAAGFPWAGVNALDAAVLAYNNISVMRQQMKPSWRIHGIITNGGTKPNVIPELTKMEFYARAPSMKEVETLKGKADACFQAAAQATGCTVDISWSGKAYHNIISNPILEALYKVNAQSLGVESASEAEIQEISGASTDMGNVSHVVPAIHPIFYIGDKVLNHTRPFTAASGSPKAQPYTITQAKALAMTAIDVYCQPHLVANMKTELKDALRHEQEA